MYSPGPPLPHLDIIGMWVLGSLFRKQKLVRGRGSPETLVAGTVGGHCWSSVNPLQAAWTKSMLKRNSCQSSKVMRTVKIFGRI